MRLRRLRDLHDFYPLGLAIRIPSAAGGTRVRVVVRADRPATQTFRIPVPEDRDGDQALEVVLVADRVAVAPGSLVARSVAIASIRPSG